MPEIYVHAVKGRTLDQKRALVKDITDAAVKNFSVPVEAVTVEIVESEPTAKAKGGVLFSEMRRRANADRAVVAPGHLPARAPHRRPGRMTVPPPAFWAATWAPSPSRP